MTVKSPGQTAYEADLAASPNYDRGGPRKPWEALDDIARDSWNRNPAPQLGKLASDASARFCQELASEHGLAVDDVAEILFRIGRQPTVRGVHILGAAGAVMAERFSAQPQKLAAVPAIAEAIAKRLGVAL